MIDHQRQSEENYLKFFIDKRPELHGDSPIFIPTRADNKTPDCYLPKNEILIEIKEIHDAEFNREIARWEKAINILKKLVHEDSRINQIAGLYLVDTPFGFGNMSHKAISRCARALVEGVLSGTESISVQNATFKIKKIGTTENRIAFSGSGQARFIDPSQVIHLNISQKVLTADKQLGAWKPSKGLIKKRILLLVNHYVNATNLHELISGLNKQIDELVNLQNIDEVWFEDITHDVGPVLLFETGFLKGFRDKCTVVSDRNRDLLSKWFSALFRGGDEEKDRLFAALRTLLGDVPAQSFPDNYVRQEMVRLGEWLVERNRWEDAKWLLRTFIEDPDPAPQDELHQQILDGKEPAVISTVRGQLAWVVQKFALNKDRIVDAMIYTDKLLKDPNLYVVSQAMVPLIEIAARRQWLKETSPDLYKLFKEDAFESLRYGKYVAIAKPLSYVFAYFKDLTTSEALRVLDVLRITEESAPLYIYFAIYRRNHFPDITFDPLEPMRRLDAVIKGQTESEKRLRDCIAWNVWKILQEEIEDLPILRPIVELFLNSHPYTPGLYGYLHYLILDLVPKNPTVGLQWLWLWLRRISQYFNSHHKEATQHFLQLDSFAPLVAKYDPTRFSEFIELASDLWKLGIYIGQPRDVFGAVDTIEDVAVRDKAKIRSRQVYDSLQALNPKLPLLN